jgi:SAM-dependent methyltransferase
MLGGLTVPWRTPALKLVGLFPGPPWSRRYLARRAHFVRTMHDDQAILNRFAAGQPLPDGYGIGLDERCVEYPWLFAHQPGGLVLDAGSTLNQRFILDRLLPRIAALHVATLAYEGIAYPERDVSYVFADLRDLPFRDGVFDTVVCISTLEHVGMDNTSYAAGATASGDPVRDRLKAAGELRRVTKPGGRLLITVPYGRREDHGWLQQLDADDVRDLAAAVGDATVSVYEYHPGGWQLSDLDQAAGLSFGDGVPAARAVACLAAVQRDHDRALQPPVSPL